MSTARKTAYGWDIGDQPKLKRVETNSPQKSLANEIREEAKMLPQLLKFAPEKWKALQAIIEGGNDIEAATMEFYQWLPLHRNRVWIERHFPAIRKMKKAYPEPVRKPVEDWVLLEMRMEEGLK